MSLVRYTSYVKIQSRIFTKCRLSPSSCTSSNGENLIELTSLRLSPSSTDHFTGLD